jgi:hypothetical protein
MLPISIEYIFVERHVLFLIPLLMVMALTATDAARPCVDRLSLYIGGALLVAYGLFSLAGTHDFLMENRTRCEALHDLIDVAHVPADWIGGRLISFNDLDIPLDRRRRSINILPPYALSYGPLRGYVEIRRYPFQRWLPVEEADILVLKRRPPPAKNK